MEMLRWALGIRWVRSNPVNSGWLVAYIMIAGWMKTYASPRAWHWGLYAICLLGLAGWWLMLRRSRAYALEATSRIATAAQGYVELQGTGYPTQTSGICCSPITMRPCVWYRTTLHRRSLLDSDWKLTDEGTALESFVLNDGTGTCVVYPHDAEIVGLKCITTENASEKWLEEIVPPGTQLTILGELKTEGGSASEPSEERAMSELLVQWKSDPKRLLERFDLNRDGVIDLKEWELARKLALGTVQRQRATTPPAPVVHTVRAPASGALFLISTYTPKWARVYFLAWGALHLALALGAMYALSKLPPT